MKGRRVYPDPKDERNGLPLLSELGDYGQALDGEWYCRAPMADLGFCGSLRNHQVTENPDGTITVRPSILMSDGRGNTYHGYLTNGIWEAC